jgi:acetate kinase
VWIIVLNCGSATIKHVRKYIGAYLAALEGAEAIVFTGGIGEHAAAEIRRRRGSGFEWAGLTMDEERNRAGAGCICTDHSRRR